MPATAINSIGQYCEYANHIGYTDVRAHEIVRVISDSCVEVRRLKATPIHTPTFVAGGFAFHCTNIMDQQWSFDTDSSAERFRIRKSRARGKAGEWFDVHGRRYMLEQKPREFYDYNF